ncbi:AMP-binding protein, partial [Nocardiopsis sp. NRRL B-16309]|uniref:AMP-binding protein n=1 Tax=Nocardiopsis sp. NRRL B-16309 TaxID=1519494 RepID=UPI0006C494E5
LKAGAAYVPLDPAYPRERLSFMASDARLHTVLASRPVLDALPDTDTPVLALEDHWPHLTHHPDTPPHTGLT